MPPSESQARANLERMVLESDDEMVRKKGGARGECVDRPLLPAATALWRVMTMGVKVGDGIEREDGGFEDLTSINSSTSGSTCSSSIVSSGSSSTMERDQDQW